MKSRLELHIEELHIHSHEAIDERRLRAAIDRELGRILDGGGEFHDGSAHRITAAPIELPMGAGAEALGERIAAALAGIIAGGGGAS